MPGQAADRNLLFGILALQMDFITRDTLIASMNAWVLEKHRPLGEILVEKGALDPGLRALLEPMVDAHVERHEGDPLASLAALSSIDSAAEALRRAVADPDVLASIARVSQASPPDPDATANYEPAAPSQAGDEPAGPDQAGHRYRKVRDHARGGLGIVFVARDEELNREVALKEIQDRHADDPDKRTRFVIEAEITGGLEHPGIVPVYGLGSYPDGRPFYAMRFIRGDSLKDAIASFHADPSLGSDPGARVLALQKLLRRFLDVCNAVAYAHSRGVLHCDLKPDNVMVGRYGETLVVDWGLAKAVGRSGFDGTGLPPESNLLSTTSGSSAETLPGSVIGTPSYMSPEQAAGRLDLLGPASDVYSLGATLYTLLTARKAFVGDNLREILRKVERAEFPRPREVSPWLDPALEAITLKAMALRPLDRYPSPRSLADDIERWLADEPVTAHREPFARRARRWARRNRTAVTAAALLMGLVGLGAVAAVQTKARNDLDRKNADLDVQRRLAEENATQAIAAVRKFGDVIANEPELKNTRSLEGLRKRLMKEPQVFFQDLRDRLQADSDARPESLARLARASHDLGHLTDEIGDKQDALIAQGAALAIRRKLADADPKVSEFQSDLATSLTEVAALLKATGKPAEALKAFESARATWQELADANPSVTRFQSELAATHHNTGNLLSVTGKTADALEAQGSALAIRQKLADASPTVTRFQQDLATTHNNIALLLMATGKPAEAMKAHELGLAIRWKLAKDHSESPDFASALGATLNNMAMIDVDARRFKEARDRLRQAIKWQRKALTSNPANPTYRQFLANHLTGLAISARGLDDLEGAAEAERGLAELRESEPAMVALDARLSAIIRGDQQPGDNRERLQLGQRAYDKALHAAAAKLWADALDAEPKLAEDRQAGHRYNAACAAAMAGCGRGKDDPSLDDAAKAKLREQAREWLQAELAAWAKLLESGSAQARPVIAPTIEYWRGDSDLAGIRDEGTLAKLPEGEREGFRALWAEVDRLLAKARAEAP